MTAAELKPGESATIVAIVPHVFAGRVMELGCVPGQRITMIRSAPLGDPIVVRIGGCELGLRRAEAELIHLSR